MTLRDPNLDLLKEGTALQNARKTRCNIEGCENFLTAYQGPGSDTLCRNHQKNLADYGGLATTKKSYSQTRGTHCEHCGYTPLTDNRVQDVEDLKVRNRLCRTLLTVDHMVSRSEAKALGWTDKEINDPSNLQTLCTVCHAIKTVINGDTMTPSNQNVESS